MKDIKYFQNIIKQKRKQTNFRDFLKVFASWKPYGFTKRKGLISRYSNKKLGLNIVSNKDFQESRDDLIKLDYDFSRGFFNNFKDLFLSVKLPALINFYKNENADFSDCNFGVKNSYLSTTVGIDSENIFYSAFCYEKVYNIFNSVLACNNSENIYFSSLIKKSSNIFYSRYINNSNNIWFSSNLIGCRECIFCDNLQNKSYCIENIEYSKEDYFQKKQEILTNKENFYSYYENVSKNAINYGCDNSSGNAIYYCENLENGYYFSRLKNGRNVVLGEGVNGCENFYDCFDVGVNASDFYGTILAGDDSDNSYLSFELGKTSNIYYSYLLENCSFCIGCIGLKNKSYCILNKQYTKEEWEKLAIQIFEQMEQDGTLGDFFPGELNPFYFNDTVAGLIGGFKKEDVENDGYLWRDEEIKVDIPEGVEVIKTTELDKYEGFDSDGNWKINPEILKVVIIDEKGNYYRIVKMEYDFLVKYELPIPRLHWMDRIKLGFGV